MLRCPKCNSENINTSIRRYGKPSGYMWCANCYYNVDNTINPDPFEIPPEAKIKMSEITEEHFWIFKCPICLRECRTFNEISKTHGLACEHCGFYIAIDK